jgi:hypothetical protein
VITPTWNYKIDQLSRYIDSSSRTTAEYFKKIKARQEFQKLRFVICAVAVPSAPLRFAELSVLHPVYVRLRLRRRNGHIHSGKKFGEGDRYLIFFIDGFNALFIVRFECKHK